MIALIFLSLCFGWSLGSAAQIGFSPAPQLLLCEPSSWNMVSSWVTHEQF